MEATCRGVVYPAQTDAMGHMTVQYYVAAFDQAFWHFISSLGYDMDWRFELQEGWADVHYEIDYREELKAGDLYSVYSDVVKIGKSSLITHHRMMDKDGVLCAEIKMTSVYFDLKYRVSKEIPEVIRTAALNLLEEH